MMRFVVGLLLMLCFVSETAVAQITSHKLAPEEQKKLQAEGRERTRTGNDFYKTRQFDKARVEYEKALSVARILYPEGHQIVANCLHNLANTLKLLDRPDAAEPLYQELISLLKKLHPGDNEATAIELNSLAYVLALQGKEGDAESAVRESLGMRKRLSKGDSLGVAECQNNLANLLSHQGHLAEAEQMYREALRVRELFLKQDHEHIAGTLDNLARLLGDEGQLADAEKLHRRALAMRQRMFKGDSREVASSLNNLAIVLNDQGKLVESERMHREALEMRQRVFAGDHQLVAASLDNLGAVLTSQEKMAEALRVYGQALEMKKRLPRCPPQDINTSLNNIAVLYTRQGKFALAEPMLREAIENERRLVPRNPFALVKSLTNLGYMLGAAGRNDEAEPKLREALSISKKIYDREHFLTATCLANLSTALWMQRKFTDAKLLQAEALAMYTRLVEVYATVRSEGEALTLLSNIPGTRDAYLSVERELKTDPATVYQVIWASKATLFRVYEHRHLTARAAAINPAVTKLVGGLADLRRRRSDMLLAPVSSDARTRMKREADLKELDGEIAAKLDELRKNIPEMQKTEDLALRTPADLQAAMPSNAAVVDILRHHSVRLGPNGLNKTIAEVYLAFVVTQRKISCVELGTVQQIEEAIKAWREAIVNGKDIPIALSAKVRDLVWGKIEKELIKDVTAAFVCPDLALSRVPWAALPGRKPSTILLDDYAVAVIPHPQFLLTHLTHGAKARREGESLVVGGVNYDTESPRAAEHQLFATSKGPAIATGKSSKWARLSGAAAEAKAVATAAEKHGLKVSSFTGIKATAPAILSVLAHARHAHFATHGFFADETFRGVFQLSEKDFEVARWGERVGRAANSPLVMTGLVCAGANNPKTPGRCILTGEHLIDLDLSGLELAVLSACETGLGEVAGGEGTYALQRAFHYAGARNVIASLWKVPDQATAALMGEFYRNLWEKQLSPMESLRQAQLTLYRNPSRIRELADGFRSPLKVVPGKSVDPTEEILVIGGKGHPRLWAAFTLSGPGQ